MAKKNKYTHKKSAKKILNAFQIAEDSLRTHGSSEGSGDEDDLIVEDGIMDARKFLKGGQDDDGFDEDEEIDSDEALGSEDDYDVLDSKFSHTIRDKEKRKSKGHVDEHSDSEGYASIDEDQLVSLSQAWDMDEQDLKKTKNVKEKDIVLDDTWDTESSQSSEDDEDEDSSSESDVFGNESEEYGDDDDIDLSKTVSFLESQKRKTVKPKNRLIVENRDENEYGIPTDGNRLSLKDMIAAVEPSVSKDAVLIDEPADNEEDRSKALATPLPKRIQVRNERGVAYEITKDEVSKWEETVQANRRAEVLKFPMNAEPSVNHSALTFKADHKPTSELEKKVQNVLSESALVDENKEATFEEIAVAKLSPEEMKKRTRELRLMRELMFREEKRAKRVKKIKSKQYHKIKKRERMRNQELVEGSDIESDAEEHDRKRAQERMSLKHKTQSQWAKSMIKSGMSKDQESRHELEEMLRQGQRLREKQLGYEEGDQSDQNVSDLEAEYANDNAEQDDETKGGLGKGVLAMDFMKKADEATRLRNLEDIEDIKRSESTLALEDDDEPENSVTLTKNQGRRVYTPNAAPAKTDAKQLDRDTLEAIREEESKNLDNKMINKFEKRAKSVSDKKISSPTEDHDNDKTEFNPWVVEDDQPTEKRKTISVIDKDSSKLSKSAAKIKKKMTKSSKVNNADTLIDISQTLGLEEHHKESDEESDSNDAPQMFGQRHLIEEAFAGDDVVKEFEDEKKRVAREEDDRTEDMTLPGWGDWVGGSKKPKKRKVTRKVDGIVQQNKRKDKNMKNVIINERVNKKNLKYQSSGVPFPFESREQYERSLRMPVGQEWTSQETHQKLTMPRIIKKQGLVIDPLKAPFQ